MHSPLSQVLHDLEPLFESALQCPSCSMEERVFGDLALRLFEVQYTLNAPYRAWCDASGQIPASITDWKHIPAVPTSAFKEFEFTCLPPSDRINWFESSGTTKRQRSKHHHSAESLGLYAKSLRPWFNRHLLPEVVGTAPEATASRMHFVSLTPPITDAQHSSLVHMLDVVSKQPVFSRRSFIGCIASSSSELESVGWQIDPQALINSLKMASDSNSPVLVAGTAFNFVHLLEALGSDACPLPAGSRVMETGGYKGRSREFPKAELHRAIGRQLHLPANTIVTEYGMTELTSQAYDQVAREAAPTYGQRSLHFPPWARPVIVSAETGKEVASGEQGLIRVVDLANAFSVIAVETEDLAVRLEDGFELMGRRVEAEQRGCSLMTV